MLSLSVADEAGKPRPASSFNGMNSMSHLWQAIRTCWLSRAAVFIADLSTAHCARQAGHS
jgi:hypothetical protein